MAVDCRVCSHNRNRWLLDMPTIKATQQKKDISMVPKVDLTFDQGWKVHSSKLFSDRANALSLLHRYPANTPVRSQ